MAKAKEAKPGVIVLSKDDDQDGFNWMSDGWNDAKHSRTKKAQTLMSKAAECIAKGKNVPEVIRLLKAAGFRVTRG